MIKVSVIIPVYNVEQYLEECLNSVINQTLKDIEIICIDDCSTDNSYEILKEYAKKDSRIIVFQNEKNKGSGPTRNVGITNAKGEYISFIDPDDYISNDFMETLYNTAKKYDSDEVTTLNVYYDENGTIYEKHMNINKYISEKEKHNPELYIEGEANVSISNLKNNTKEYIYVTLTNKLHKRSFILENNLLYMDIKSGADDEDLFNRIMLNSPKCSYNHKGIYYHRKRAGSLMYNYRKDLEYLINTIKLMTNSIEYTKNNFPEHLNTIYIRTFDKILWKFSQSYVKDELYEYIHKFSLNIKLENPLELKNNFTEFLLIKASDSYNKYLLNKFIVEKLNNINNINNNINNINNNINNINNNINNINNNINNINNNINKNRIKIFGIDNFNDKKIIYFFGIKITLKNKK